MENGQTTAFDAATQGWDDATRMRVLEVLHAWGLSKNDPTAVIAVLLGHVVTAGEAIPAGIVEQGNGLVELIRKERLEFEIQAKEFGRLAELIPAKVEEALRGLIPAIADQTGVEAAKHIDAATADRVAERVGAAIAKREQETGSGIMRFVEAGEESVTTAASHVASVAAVTKRASIMAGFWSPLATLAAVAVMAYSLFIPGGIKFGATFDAGRAAQFASDANLARNAPATWAKYVRANHGGR